MKIKSFTVNLYKKKKLWIIIICALVIALVLILTTFFLVMKESKTIRNKFSKESIFNATSYYAEYEVTVFSNKNQNTYNLREWYYKKDDEYRFKIETIGDGNNFSYFGTNNTLNISANGQINSMNLSNFETKRLNVMSISTFIELYKFIDDKISNQTYEYEKCCKIEERDIDGKKIYTVDINKNIDQKCAICKTYSDILISGMKITKFELILDKNTLTPIQYIIYTEDGKSFMDIIYHNFDVNVDF